jgi:hypothetical protein
LFDRISAKIGDEILGIHGTLLPAATELKKSTQKLNFLEFGKRYTLGDG